VVERAQREKIPVAPILEDAHLSLTYRESRVQQHVAFEVAR
jgi:hypothetical protein